MFLWLSAGRLSALLQSEAGGESPPLRPSRDAIGRRGRHVLGSGQSQEPKRITWLQIEPVLFLFQSQNSAFYYIFLFVYLTFSVFSSWGVKTFTSKCESNKWNLHTQKKNISVVSMNVISFSLNFEFYVIIFVLSCFIVPSLYVTFTCYCSHVVTCSYVHIINVASAVLSSLFNKHILMWTTCYLFILYLF